MTDAPAHRAELRGIQKGIQLAAVLISDAAVETGSPLDLRLIANLSMALIDGSLHRPLLLETAATDNVAGVGTDEFASAYEATLHRPFVAPDHDPLDGDDAADTTDAEPDKGHPAGGDEPVNQQQVKGAADRTFEAGVRHGIRSAAAYLADFAASEPPDDGHALGTDKKLALVAALAVLVEISNDPADLAKIAQAKDPIRDSGVVNLVNYLGGDDLFPGTHRDVTERPHRVARPRATADA